MCLYLVHHHRSHTFVWHAVLIAYVERPVVRALAGAAFDPIAVEAELVTAGVENRCSGAFPQ